MVLRGFGISLPTGYSVHLRAASLQDIRSIHVFKEIAAGELAFWGGLSYPSLEVDISYLVQDRPTQDRTMGLEGLFFRSVGEGAVLPFDGEIDLTLELRKGATVVASDSVRMKVAPWIMLPYSQASEKVWAFENNVTKPLRLTAENQSGYHGLEHSGQLETETEASRTAWSAWLQDHVAVGYYQRPGGPLVKSVFRMPYKNYGGFAQPTWPQHRLLSGGAAAAPDTATFQLRQATTTAQGAGDFGGNLDVIPPSDACRLGRLVVGDSSSPQLWSFLASQEVQGPPIILPTRWLSVGHVDEFVGFPGTRTNGTQDVIISSPADAYQLMDAIPAPERASHVFFATGQYLPQVGTVPSMSEDNRRIHTDKDYHTGERWKYIRIVGGSNAAGQVARISGGGDNFLKVELVWDIPANIIRSTDASLAYQNHIATGLKPQSHWFRFPQAGDRFVVVADSRIWASKEDAYGNAYPMPAFITVEEVLADRVLRKLNTGYVEQKMQSVKDLLDASGCGPFNYIPVPVIYFGDGARLGDPDTPVEYEPHHDEETGVRTLRHALDEAETARAMTPNLANYQYVGGAFYFPRQFGPKDSQGSDRV